MLKSKKVDLTELWLEEFTEEYLCSLCANRGMIPARHLTSPAGYVIRPQAQFCICPNGRELKKSKINP